MGCVAHHTRSLGKQSFRQCIPAVKLVGAHIAIWQCVLPARLAEPPQLGAGQEALALAFPVASDSRAGVRVEWPEAPGLRQVEHLADPSEHAVGLRRLGPEAMAQVGDVLTVQRRPCSGRAPAAGRAEAGARRLRRSIASSSGRRAPRGSAAPTRRWSGRRTPSPGPRLAPIAPPAPAAIRISRSLMVGSGTHWWGAGVNV